MSVDRIEKCLRGDCGGEYGADGYCAECGFKAPTVPTRVETPPGQPATPSAVPPPRTPSAGSAQRTPPAGSAQRTPSAGPGTAPDTGPGTATDKEPDTAPGPVPPMVPSGTSVIPWRPIGDPTSMVLSNPGTPEPRRFCATCRGPVGRTRPERGPLEEGFCVKCGTRFRFLPDLAAGEVVHDRYKIEGCVAQGGVGWVYLARDLHVSDSEASRWVSLKGLIDKTGPEAIALTDKERRSLVEVDHPNIVKIHDFVSHHNARYIVMEFVVGDSLRQVLTRQRRGLPLEHVLGYALEILKALEYLHGRGLLYCDLKPENVIHSGDRIKIIDLGAVRRIADPDPAIYGTPGFQAPEVPKDGVSIASDLYTVGRTLAVLSLGVRDLTTTYPNSLPAADREPLFVAEESFHRLLLRATHKEPHRRFRSAAEMAEQVRGVRSQVLALEGSAARPVVSTHFLSELRSFGTGDGETSVARALTPAETAAPPDCAAVADALPVPQVDATDPAAAFLHTVQADPLVGLDQLRDALAVAPMDTPGVVLQRIRTHIARKDPDRATVELGKLVATGPEHWRVSWYRGLAAIAAGKPDQARAPFDDVYDALPGELAPVLALAATAELQNRHDEARRYYERVWRTDRSYISAGFGLARMLVHHGDRSRAVRVLDEVPESSALHRAAQVAAVRVRVAILDDQTAQPLDDLTEAARRVTGLPLDALGERTLRLEVLRTALDWINSPVFGQHADAAAKVTIFEYELNERRLRFGLERAYRRLAEIASDRSVQIELVSRANRVRPRTFV